MSREIYELFRYILWICMLYQSHNKEREKKKKRKKKKKGGSKNQNNEYMSQV